MARPALREIEIGRRPNAAVRSVAWRDRILRGNAVALAEIVIINSERRESANAKISNGAALLSQWYRGNRWAAAA